MNLTNELRRRGFGPEQIAGATVNGKPLVESEKAAKPLSRYKSKLESLYAMELQYLKEAGEIQDWRYEPVTLVIVDADGKRCRYCPDFLVLHNNGSIELVETKGFMREAARIRFLAARERYPFWRFTMIRRNGGQWETML